MVTGEAVTASLFVLTLSHSDAFLVAAFLAVYTETLQAGHVRAFDHLGGVPTRISCDDSRIAVVTIVGQ